MANYRRSALISFLSLPLGLLAEMNFRRLPSLPAKNPDCVFPSLSIIIPARNEGHNLQVLLPSLFNIYYPGKLEILVVDDHSSDDTSRIAESFKVRLLRLERNIPPGWKGKPYTCHQGALSARGDWLLFTDADTLHTREGIARAICFVQRADLDGLSLFLNHQGVNRINGLVLDVAFTGLFAGWGVENAMLNGQFILIRREVYFDSGGFATVRGEVLEDVALGNLLAKLGYRLRMMKGDDIAGVNMYATPKQMFDRLSRLGSGTLRWQGVSAGLTALYVTALVSPLIAIVGVLFGGLKWFWIPMTWSMASLGLVPWSRRSGNGKLALLAPLGALVVLLSALFGIVSRSIGIGIPWKGRKV